MTLAPNSSKTPFRLSAVLKARCPACHRGAILRGLFGIHRRCPVCRHDFHPEPGYFLGAMMISFFLTAMLTVPPTIALKILDVDTTLLISFPLILFLFIGSFLLIYSRVLWLHLEYRISRRLDGDYTAHRASQGENESDST